MKTITWLTGWPLLFVRLAIQSVLACCAVGVALSCVDNPESVLYNEHSPTRSLATAEIACVCGYYAEIAVEEVWRERCTCKLVWGVMCKNVVCFRLQVHLLLCWAYCNDNVKTAAHHAITLLATLLRDEAVSWWCSFDKTYWLLTAAAWCCSVSVVRTLHIN